MADKKLMRYSTSTVMGVAVHTVSERGDWVKYEDAAKLEAENKRLREMLEGSDGAVTVIAKKLGTAEARLTAALTVLKAVEWVIHGFDSEPFCPKCRGLNAPITFPVANWMPC